MNANANANLNTLIGAGALAGMRTRAWSRQLDHPSDAVGMGIHVKQEDNGGVSIFAHTPPSAMATSYERTSGKRARAGVSQVKFSLKINGMFDLMIAVVYTTTTRIQTCIENMSSHYAFSFFLC